VTTPSLLGATDALAPIRAALERMASVPGAAPLNGLVPGLTAPVLALPGPWGLNGAEGHDGADGRDGVGRRDAWVSAMALVTGEALDSLLDTAARRWNARAHAAAALAWKSYTYWVALPAVIGYAAARRVPLLRPDTVVARWSSRQPFLTIGLTSVDVAVLPSDPLAVDRLTADLPSTVRVVPGEAALLAAMRESLVDEHLAPVLANITARVNVGRRTLWGSLASAVAYGLSRAAEVVPGPVLPTASTILDALGVADLVALAPRADGQAGLDIQRRTCCLAFTLPEPKVCSGCCIR
jgi:hypothetical protein